MTHLEALTAGIVWGALHNAYGGRGGGTVDVPGYPFSDDAVAPAVVVLRTKSGAEVLITVTETRGPTE